MPNLLATTLAIIAPFHQTDWQTPLAARPIKTDVAPNTLIAGIPQALGFNQYDWPLPAVRARAVPQADSSGNQLLQGIAQQMGFNVSDWPTPAKARLAPLVNPVPNNLALGIPQALIFNQSDWVTPQRPQAIRFDDAPNVLITIPNAAAPFAQVDWITPLRARAAPQDFEQAGQTTRGIVPPAPLLPLDLPTPAGRAALRLDDPPNLLARALAGAPFAQVDWSTPARARASPQDAPQAGLLTLGLVAPAPFTAADVGAVSYRPRPALLPEPVQNALILGLPPVMGANQSDWPQPYRASMAPPWGDAPNATIIQPAAAAFPFGLGDWPTPRAAQTLWDVHFIWANSQLPPIPPPPPALTFSIDPLPIPLYTDWQGVSKAERAKIRRIEKKLKRLRGEYVKAEQQQLAAAHRGASPQPAALARHAALDRDITALAAALERVALASIERDDEEALIVQWDADERSSAALLAEVAALLAKGDT